MTDGNHSSPKNEPEGQIPEIKFHDIHDITFILLFYASEVCNFIQNLNQMK